MITYHNFSIDRIPDNEIAYFNLLRSVIDSVEDAYYLAITKTPDSYKIRISLSDAIFTNTLVEQLNNLNNALQMRVEYGKSLKKGNIFFSLPTK